MKKFLLIAIVGLILTSSCGTTARFSIPLSSVESPADAKRQIVETKITSFQDKDVTKYTYEDDFIKINWNIEVQYLRFNITNKTNSSFKILWDDMSYIDHLNASKRIIHSDVKFIEKNNPQTPTIVAKKSSFENLIIPSDNVYFLTGGYGKWQERALFVGDKKEFIGKTVKVLFPISIENVTKEYIFEFEVQEPVKR